MVLCTSDNPVPTSSTAGAASQYPDSDSKQQTNLSSPVYPEEEGEVSDREASIPEQKPDQ